jgi:hypothetical protein
MTIFDFISGIIFTKKKDLFKAVDEELEFSPYLINRWISMYSPQTALLCNTINKYLGIFDNKSDLYSLFFCLFPQLPFKKIQYFKKVKQEAHKIDDMLVKIASSKELSLREIKLYYSMLNIKES